jgi:kanamycin kinase
MIKRELLIDMNAFPQSISKYLENSKIYDSSSSKIKVYYSDAGYYVKVAEKCKLSHEAELSRRFCGLGMGVEVLEYLSTDKDYFVTREAAGTDLTHCTDEPEMICRILADSLKMLHSQDCEDLKPSPAFGEYLEIACKEADKAFKATPVTEYFGITDIASAIDIARANSKKLTADTFIHGDACLPNVIQNNGKFSPFIDFAMSGKGDKHIDLYWAVWSLWYNLKTAAYSDVFLDMYGRDNFDIELVRTVAALEVLF